MAPGLRAASGDPWFQARSRLVALVGLVGLVSFALAGCAAAPTELSEPPATSQTNSDPTSAVSPQPTASPSSRQPRSTPTTPTGRGSAASPRKVPSEGRRSSDGRIQRAELSIPAIGVRDIRVVPYRGSTDDAAGTEIQDKGRAASPYGPRGGTGPGGIGNYQVTAHRTSSTAAFRRLPALRRGDRVTVRTARTTYIYRITATRRTSFRSAASLRAQRAAVPGHPGERPRRAMITLSTCLTMEDHAAGNYWSDELGNPEHRIDKIGVLIGAHRVRGRR